MAPRILRSRSRLPDDGETPVATGAPLSSPEAALWETSASRSAANRAAPPKRQAVSARLTHPGKGAERPKTTLVQDRPGRPVVRLTNSLNRKLKGVEAQLASLIAQEPRSIYRCV